MTKYELEHAMRTNAIIAAARSMNITDDDLLTYSLDAIDELHHHAYDAMTADHDNARTTIILMMNAVIGYDDDHDDFIHDLGHALNMIDYCSDHPQNCSTCCDLCE